MNPYLDNDSMGSLGQPKNQQPPVDLLFLDNNSNNVNANVYNTPTLPVLKSSDPDLSSPAYPFTSQHSFGGGYPYPTQPSFSNASPSPSPTPSVSNLSSSQTLEGLPSPLSSPTPTAAQAPPTYSTNPYNQQYNFASSASQATYGTPPASTPPPTNTTSYSLSPKLTSTPTPVPVYTTPFQTTPPPQSPQQQPQQQSSQQNNAALVQMIEKLQINFDNVLQRLEGVEGRLSSLEIVTKDILNTQKTMQAQQKKVQDTLEAKEKTPPTFEEPVKPKPATTTVTSYPPPPPATTVPSMPSYYSSPPPMNFSSATSFVPVTQVSSNDSSKADEELAKRLQAEFDAESKSSSTSAPKPKPTPAPAPSMSSVPYTHVATSKPQSKTQNPECPICQQHVPSDDLAAHVEQHFEDDESTRTGRPAAKAGVDPKKDAAANKGFFGKLFSKDEAAKPAETPKPTESHTPSTKAETVSNTRDRESSTPQQQHPQMMAYPPYMAPRGYYPAGMVPAGQFRPPQGYYPGTAYPPMQRSQQGAPQYLYYPTLDQQPPQ